MERGILSGNRKRFLSVILTILFLLLISATTMAASGKCGSKVRWKLSKGTLTISGKGKMKDYYYEMEKHAPWYKYRSKIKKIVVKKGVTRIGSGVFSGCNKAKNIKIAGTVTSIGDFAFDGCRALKKLTIPEGVKRIEGYAFSSCRKLKTLILPKSLTYMDNWLFYDTRSLKDIFFQGSQQQWKALIASDDPEEEGPYNLDILDDIKGVKIHCK